MFWGQLTYDDERVMLNIIESTTECIVANNEIYFTLDGEQHVVCVSYMKKPKDRMLLDDSSQELIAKPCILINLNSMKVPIFKNGIIYADIFLPETNIKHTILIKNKTASDFYNFVFAIWNESQNSPFSP